MGIFPTPASIPCLYLPAARANISTVQSTHNNHYQVMKKISLLVMCLTASIATSAQFFSRPPSVPGSLGTNSPTVWQRSGSHSTNTFARQKQIGGKSFAPTNAAPASKLKTLVATEVVGRGPHHKVMRTVVAQTNVNGQAFYRTNSYTELATGMHYQENGDWKETKELIEPYEGGAIARFGPHKVSFEANLNASGALNVEMADGQRLRAHILGLRYFDTESGKTVLLAQLKDSQGQIVGSNEVIYANCFASTTDLSVKASVRYTFRKSGLSQDVIAHELPAPESFNLNKTSTRLQVLTEFLNPPPVQTVARPERRRQGQLEDYDLDFGTMRIGQGRAFNLGEEKRGRGTAVRKQLIRDNGRHVLIEDIPAQRVFEKLSKPAGASITPTRGAQWLAGVTNQVIPQAPKIKRAEHSMQLASAFTLEQGYVVDWELEGTAGDFTLQGDTTYLVVDTFTIESLIVEGGAVVKYSDEATGGILVNGSYTDVPVVCRTGPYQPAIFTSMHDDSVGSLIPDSTGIPVQNDLTYLNSYLWPGVHHLRFLYAGVGIGTSGEPAAISHCQFLHCGYSVEMAFGQIDFYNVLISDCSSVVHYTEEGEWNFYSFNASHISVDQAVSLIEWPENGIYSDEQGFFNVINSIFANVPQTSVPGLMNDGDRNGFYNSSPIGDNPIYSTASPFQTGGAGQYYLKMDSGFRASGTTAIDLNGLKQKTTQPPINFPRFMEVSGELTLFPQIPRYVSGPPDLGYHYDALDYTVAAMMVKGGTINIQPGTAVGFRQEFAPEDWWPWWYTHAGFWLENGASFISHGMPDRPNTFVAANLVQELPDDQFALYRWWYEVPVGLASFVAAFEPDSAGSPPPALDFRFSNFYAAGPDDIHLWSGYSWDLEWNFSLVSCLNWRLRDCNLRGGAILVGTPVWWSNPYYEWGTGSIEWFNNLFDRVDITLDPTYYADGFAMNVDLAFHGNHNLFRGQRFFLNPVPATAGHWTFTDNLFDKVAFEEYWPGPIDHDFNAYWQRTSPELESWQVARLTANSGDGSTDAANDQLLAATPAYQSGPLGDYYLATSSPLYQTSKRGSRTVAEAGLYHYTTRADQTKDGAQAGNVIIGRHYVATANSSSTQPKDSDGDGIPDSVEDQNGDGVVDASETDPTLAQTETGVPDATNPIYDDIDLDGDGMVGAVEKVLGRLPLVSDNPLITPQFAAGIESETAVATEPVDFDALAGNGQITLMANGAPVPFIRNDRDANGYCQLTWNTIYEQSGNYLVQAGIKLDGSSKMGGVGPIGFASITVNTTPYSYALVPGTADWNNATVSERITSATIPQGWQQTATSWQLFISTLNNPYFRLVWGIGRHIPSSYAAAKSKPNLLLNTLEAAPEFGVNTLRYLTTLDMSAMVTVDCWQCDIPVCWVDYTIVCHMAGLDSALLTIDLPSRQRLFKLAVWDANYLLAQNDNIVATAPIRLMYSIYNKPESFRGTFPAGVVIPELAPDQLAMLEVGHLPAGLNSAVLAAKTALGLTSRP
jgi:hypothetical protein